MWLLTLFGIFDGLTLLALLAVHFSLLPWKLAYIFAAYILFKGFYFLNDFASLVDLAIGIFFILMFLGVRTWVVWLFALYLFQKVLVSIRDL